MKIAIVGSRDLIISDTMLSEHLSEAKEIVSGGARGVDTCAAIYAEKNNIKLTVFLPRYELYGHAAPIKRNKEIVDYSDRVVVFWDGISKGTLSVIQYANKTNKECEIVLIDQGFFSANANGHPER